MTGHGPTDYPPFTVVMCDTGRTVVYQKLEDANRYMTRQLALGLTSCVLNAHGQMVGANEIAGAFQRLFGQDGAA